MGRDFAFDVVIVGAGLVGVSFALILKKKEPDLSILVVESNKLISSGKIAVPDSDIRGIALSRDSKKILQIAGLWTVLEKSATPIESIHVSDKGHPGIARLNRSPDDIDPLGYVVEGRYLRSTLRKNLSQSDIQIWYSTEIIDALIEKDRVRLVTSNTKTDIIAKLMVISDGAYSKTASKLGFCIKSKALGQKAIIANVTLDRKHRGIAYERFTQSGVVAMLPLSTSMGQFKASLVWTRPSECALRLEKATDGLFLDELQAQFGYRNGIFTDVSARASFVITTSFSEEMIRARSVLLGNVAHNLHPVAGQGLNLSLRDAAKLAEAVSLASNANRDFGSVSMLDQYRKDRLHEQQLIAAFTGNLQPLFSSKNFILRLGRNLGLFSLDFVPVLREKFLHFGINGRAF
ncbi:MAG: hypothetical protein CMK36_06960 [Porticoccaceae bacterium]|nr:hypothetical protein [Porticoccaceae bacterium]